MRVIVMTTDLQPPSPDLATRLLAEVDYSDRLIGVQMQCLSGPTTMDLYSLELAARFMRMDDIEDLRNPTSGASYGYIDPQALVWWLDNVHGDRELARAIQDVASQYSNYLAQVEPIRELLDARLEQCKSPDLALAG